MNPKQEFIMKSCIRWYIILSVIIILLFVVNISRFNVSRVFILIWLGLNVIMVLVIGYFNFVEWREEQGETKDKN